MAPVIKSGQLVLFAGDSITFAGRDLENPFSVGMSYVMFIQTWFSALYPRENVRFANIGIGGNRVRDLKERWDRDCISLEPDWVTILIGINDTWRRYDQNDPTSAEAFESDYRDILERTRERLNARLILCEPFVLPEPEDRIEWREDLDPKIAVVRKLAREFDAILVPLDGIFAAASTTHERFFWTKDGVHPTFAGRALIAQAWLRAVGAL
jgi:acyl-CoA thioesterase-1